MKIVLTGASGFIGRMLVPLLAAKGARLMLVGRDPDKLAKLFPNHLVCSYEALEQECSHFDLLVHLAVLNNNASSSEQDFQAANVNLLLDVVRKASQARIGRLVNICSTHALGAFPSGPYARSKKQGAQRLREISGINATNLFLPAVYGDGIWSGSLAVLNALPGRLAKAVFFVASAFKPTLHVNRLAEHLWDLPSGDLGEDRVLTDGQLENALYRTWKRGLDLVGALLIVGLLWWLLILLWVAVRIQSPGPGLFAQTRVGRNGRNFTCYKFRTMQVGTQEVATNLISSQAVTRLGRVLRRTKLDELPQVWNILRNEMSFIGPRPCLPNQVELIEARRVRGVFALKPGISGLGQVEGIDMSEPIRLARIDQRYGALQSIVLDLRLMAATVSGKGQGDRIANTTP